MRHDFFDRYAHLDSPVHRLDARVKLLALLATVLVAVSAPPEAWPVFLLVLGFLVALAALSRVPVRYLAMRLMLPLPVVLMAAVFIPFFAPEDATGSVSVGIEAVRVSRSGLMLLWNVAIKALLGIFATLLLTSTTPFPKLLLGLEQLRAPRLALMLAGFTYRYLFILVDETERMERAVASRGYRGRWLWHAGVIGRIIGTLFLRSYERAERVFAAMASRGFDGHAVEAPRAPMCAKDALFLAASLGFLLFARMLPLWI